MLPFSTLCGARYQMQGSVHSKEALHHLGYLPVLQPVMYYNKSLMFCSKPLYSITPLTARYELGLPSCQVSFALASPLSVCMVSRVFRSVSNQATPVLRKPPVLVGAHTP